MLTSIMKSNRFHYSYPLILCFITFEFLLFLFSFQLPNKKEENRSIFTYTPPSIIMVFLSLLGSFFIELVKERNALHKLIYPHYQQSTNFEERIGMPPSYMVVQISWDEDDLIKNPIDNNKCHVAANFSERKISTPQMKILKMDLTMENKIFCPNKKSHVVRYLLNHLTVMSSNVNHPHKKAGPNSDAEEHEINASTENNEEICRLLTNNFNIFVVSSAVGVAAILALNKQTLNLKHKAPKFCRTSQKEWICSTA